MSILGTRRFPQKAHRLRQFIFGAYTVSLSAASPPYLSDILGGAQEGTRLRVPASLVVVVLLPPGRAPDY